MLASPPVGVVSSPGLLTFFGRNQLNALGFAGPCWNVQVAGGIGERTLVGMRRIALVVVLALGCEANPNAEQCIVEAEPQIGICGAAEDWILDCETSSSSDDPVRDCGYAAIYIDDHGGHGGLFVAGWEALHGGPACESDAFVPDDGCLAPSPACDALEQCRADVEAQMVREPLDSIDSNVGGMTSVEACALLLDPRGEC